MRNILLTAAVAVIVLSSCATANPNLYNWGGNSTTNGETKYENLAYKTYKNQSPKNRCEMVCLYESMVSKFDGQRQTPPPGICAEYGYLLLQPETASTFVNNATDAQKRIFGSGDLVALFKERGELMLSKELEYYPEAARFLEPLIRKFKER